MASDPISLAFTQTSLYTFNQIPILLRNISQVSIFSVFSPPALLLMHSLLFVFFTQFSWLLPLHSIACCQDVKHVAEVYLCNHMNTDKDIECLQNDSQSNRSKPKFLYQHVLPEQLLFHHNLKAVFKKTHIIYFLSLSLCLSLPLFSLFMVLVSGVLIPASVLSQLHPSNGGFRTKQIC